MTDARDALMVARNTDGKLVRRPLSPHVMTYRWPLSGLLSGTHRVTGLALCVGTLLMTWWLVAAATSDSAFAAVQWFLSSWLGILCLLGWTFALFQHLFSGIRHLAWNAVYGFEKAEYRATNWAVIGASAACTLVTWIIGFVAW
ncbi:MAG TPA: succinate dehydrogenase, cytochrome b556 subunit [Acetobacteraceae bacterium]|nr:succinate dehydrogenase, cytochrome b556 subunit [Acetobacteraceae bacterium]